jgi:predicted GNAT family acetyltransferase
MKHSFVYKMSRKSRRKLAKVCIQFYKHKAPINVRVYIDKVVKFLTTTEVQTHMSLVKVYMSLVKVYMSLFKVY